jgi:hypothetical protein
MIGYIYYLQLRKKEEYSDNNYRSVIVIAAATILVVFFYLKKSEPDIVKDDSEKFSRTMEHFGALQELALEAMQRSDTTSKEVYLTQLRKTALIDWAECVNLFDEAEKFNLSSQQHTFRIDMSTYSKHRVEQTLLVIKAAEEGTNKYQHSIDSIENEIESVMEKIQNGNTPTQDL